MEQPNWGNLRSMPLDRLVSDALGELERLGYSRRSLRIRISLTGSVRFDFSEGHRS